METTNKLEVASHAAQNVGVTLTGVAWFWNWLGVNHDAITAACALIGATLAITGFLINQSAKKKTSRRK